MITYSLTTLQNKMSKLDKLNLSLEKVNKELTEANKQLEEDHRNVNYINKVAKLNRVRQRIIRKICIVRTIGFLN